MILYPAIDLKGGQCVRLRQGDMAKADVFHDDPAAQARAFAAQGFTHLHVVDLDGAVAGQSVNGAAVDAVLGAAKLKVQLGGGLRDQAAVEYWLARGVARVVLGTAAVREPEFVRSLSRAHANRICVALDARNGALALEGWREQSGLRALDVARSFSDCPLGALIHTDIQRDGMGRGLNVAASCELAKKSGLPVIASGGVAGLDDIRALLAAPTPLAGAICGRALYEGRLDARAALALVEASGKEEGEKEAKEEAKKEAGKEQC